MTSGVTRPTRGEWAIAALFIAILAAIFILFI